MVLIIIQTPLFKSIFNTYRTTKGIDSSVQYSIYHRRNSTERNIWHQLLFSSRLRTLSDVSIGNATREKGIELQNHRIHSITEFRVDEVYLEYLH